MQSTSPLTDAVRALRDAGALVKRIADGRAGPWLVCLAAAAFYAATLQPSLSWGDGVRLQHEAVSGQSFALAVVDDATLASDPFPFARLGVAAWDHPLYIVLGHALVRALPSAKPLLLVNSLSAIFGALGVALVFHVARTATGSSGAAVLAAAALMLSHTYWFHAVTPEVYALLTALLLLAMHWYRRFEDTGRRLALLGSAFAFGLAAATHVMAFLAVPSLVIYLAWTRWATGRRQAMSWRHGLAAAPAFVAGFLVYLIQLARMLRTFSPAQAVGPMMGTIFTGGILDTTPIELAASGVTFVGYLLLQFGPLGVALGAWGLLGGPESHARLRRLVLALLLSYTAFGLLYRVTDQFTFFLIPYVLWALALALGVSRAQMSLSPVRQRWLMGGLALSIGLMPVVYRALPALARAVGVTEQTLGIPQIGAGVRDGLRYYTDPNKHGDTTALDFGLNTLDRLPANAVVLAEWYTDTDEYFILDYLARVDGRRPDVEVLGWPLVLPQAFDSALAVEEIERRLPAQPVFLASLSDEYYAARMLAERYCVVEEANLYRVYVRGEAPPERLCLP